MRALHGFIFVRLWTIWTWTKFSYCLTSYTITRGHESHINRVPNKNFSGFLAAFNSTVYVGSIRLFVFKNHKSDFVNIFYFGCYNAIIKIVNLNWSLVVIIRIVRRFFYSATILIGLNVNIIVFGEINVFVEEKLATKNEVKTPLTSTTWKITWTFTINKNT